MNEQYKQVIVSLYNDLSLTPPSIEKVISLQVGEQVVHITEYPQGQLLMFSDIGLLDNFNLTALLKLNMFSQLVCKPVVGFDEHSNNAVVWSRQKLMQCDSNNAYQQLDSLSQVIDVAIESVHKMALNTVISNFDPKHFRV
ncbi:CesT family type III secretion system chaperone [Shewanella sp. VB17]|uniref:CesT family type III secretion system chaperone n=1 Tax=Shewanella sp. VB17 TaxID=2739432 RepID=UPI001565B766|nr:CesT family type III secretion system chaperone [Shewanella sp. VB17]NRD71764.1 CesT family type III secretion system chaperone [Shewanella sp. VB17]